MKSSKWEVLYGCGKKRFVTAPNEPEAREEAFRLLPTTIKFIRKCNKR
jgi:hypothetical protein